MTNAAEAQMGIPHTTLEDAMRTVEHMGTVTPREKHELLAFIAAMPEKAESTVATQAETTQAAIATMMHQEESVGEAIGTGTL